MARNHGRNTRRLRQTLGLWQVTLSGVILGAGVYALIAPGASLAGNALWLSFVVAALAAGFTAYAYARLGALQPKNRLSSSTRRSPSVRGSGSSPGS